MTAYVDKDGKYLGVFVGAKPPDGAIAVETAPNDARQIWKDGSWSKDPGRSYRELRSQAYADNLGKDKGNVINTIGDVLDVLIAEIVARGPAVTPEFAEMIAKIVAIKTANPKS